MRSALLFLVMHMLVMLSTLAHAEVYRWTDKEGKTHFSDNKPKTSAANITATVKQQNIDTSTQEHQKLENIFRRENAADVEFKQQQTQPSAAQQQRCVDARNYLNTIDGRVQFVDNKGKIINVSEEERKALVTKTYNFIQKKCPH